MSKVLIQKKHKLSTKDLRSSTKSSITISAQVKEALFIQKVTELEDEERRNQLKWQVKLGESLVDSETKKDILQSRAKAEYEYKLAIGVPFIQQETKRAKTCVFDCRTVRMYDKLAREDISFDMFKNKTWQLRFLSLDRFIQAARKIILKKRLEKVLLVLRRFIDSWNEALSENSENEQEVKLNIENYIEFYVKQLNGENTNQNEVVKMLSTKSMGTCYFPYVNEFKEFQNQKVRHYEKLSSISQLDSLDTVAVRHIEFSIKAQIPYSTLAIPVTYKLNTYNQANSNFYVSKHENRLLALRQGAEDELTQIDANLIRVSSDPDQKLESEVPLNINNIAPKEEDVIRAVQIESSTDVNSEGTKIIDLDPSLQLSEPIEYSPMHIFVSFSPCLVFYIKIYNQ